MVLERQAVVLSGHREESRRRGTGQGGFSGGGLALVLAGTQVVQWLKLRSAGHLGAVHFSHARHQQSSLKKKKITLIHLDGDHPKNSVGDEVTDKIFSVILFCSFFFPVSQYNF